MNCFRYSLLLICLLSLGAADVEAQALKVLSVTSNRSDVNWQFKVQCDQPVEPLVLQCLIDTDANPLTGYTGGYDLLLESDLLYRFSGTDTTGWTWQQFASITRRFNGTTVTCTVALDSLETSKLRMKVRLLKTDYSTVLGESQEIFVSLDELPVLQTAKIVVTPLAPVKDNHSLSARQRVKQAQSFYCYYGSGKVGQLSAYDLVILHSPQMDKADIATLKEQGVVAVGYITVGEDAKLRKGNGKGPDGQASWYFDRDHDGKPDQNPIWKSYFANPMDPNWRLDRVREAKRLVEQEGYDGIFLDTIDTVGRFPDTQMGMIQLVQDLREALPNAPIVLNQGYSLLTQLAPLADAFMLESFTATYDFQSKAYILNTPSSMDWHAHKVRQYVQPALEQHSLKVLVLDYAKADDLAVIQAAANRATTFGFLFAAAPIFLDDVYVNDIVGKPDSHWLQKQATPQTMSLMLPESANGFPMNTVILPSSCHGGYSVKPIVDGIANRSLLHWSESSWASAEIAGEAIWLDFEFDTPQSGGKLQIIWATDQGKTHMSQHYSIEVKVNGQWQQVSEASGSPVPVSHHPLPAEPYMGIRIYQPAGGGSAQRPDLMWIAQVKRLVH